MASSSAALKVAAVCMLALFAGQLMMATPAAAEPGLEGLLKRRSLLAGPAAGSPVCVPDNCPICVLSKCPFCIPVCKKCVFCVQLCICDCNLKTFQCSGVCYKNCMLRTDLD